MEHPKILFALTDSVERSKLETVLRPLDVEVILASDGAGVIETAVKEHPAIIVTDTGLSVVSAQKVLSILRHNLQSASIAFFFISDRAIDIPGFKLGTDTFLLRPLNAEEVLSRFARALEGRAGRRTGAREIIGKLNQMGLPDILQFLNINTREGELRVARGAQRGTIYIQNGEILNAVLEGVEKEKALYRMLGWSDGEFEFIPCTVQTARKIGASSSTLLMEGMRQIDEYNRSINTLPGPEKSLRAVKKVPVPEGLHPAAYELLRHIKLYSTVAELVERSIYTDFEVYGAITVLITRGVVTVKSDTAAVNKGIFTIEESLLISERLSARKTGSAYPDTVKLFILSTSGKLVDRLLGLCARVPDFKIPAGTLMSEAAPGGRIGEVASLCLTTGMEVTLFSVPVVSGMAPLLRSFSSNIVGVVLMTDSVEGAMTDTIISERDALVKERAVPVVHLCAPDDSSQQGPGEFERCLKLGPDDTLWQLDTGSAELVVNIFRQLFSGLMK